MRCLIDADILAYEISASGQFKDEESGELVIRSFDAVAELLDQRIKEIEGECWATEESVLYLTGDQKLFKLVNKARGFSGEEKIPEFKENFRKEVAKTKVYKGSRKTEKPYHFDNIRAYMLSKYKVEVAFGFEADDLIAIEMTKSGDRLDVICCTRDKDLRMVPGMHFGWPCGAQEQLGPLRVTSLGELSYDEGKNKLKGNGYLFFLSQLITGDSVDNIPGIPKGGPKLAYNTLKDVQSEEEGLKLVWDLYKSRLPETFKEYFKEQATLLWMKRGEDDDQDWCLEP